MKSKIGDDLIKEKKSLKVYYIMYKKTSPY